MIQQNYQLGNTVLKSTEALTLWHTERGVVETSKNTLAILLKLHNQREGYILHGQGKLLLDAIVETDEGAVGKSVEKELNEPFLMLGKTEEIQQHLIKASEENLAEMGYKNQQGFADEAEDLCDRFFKGKVNSHEGFDRDHGSIFVFQNEAGKLDILIAKDSKLVYTATDMVFVSNEDKSVLRKPGEVVVSKNGKSVIVNKGKSIIIKK